MFHRLRFCCLQYFKCRNTFFFLFFFFLCMFFLVGNGNAAPASFALGLLDRISEQLPRNENQMRCAMALLLHF
uniref:Uncharacterized protein n=1 Tax=Ixodes ricinus TaxID=34613 RepID=A0A6B0U386_IXORI